MPQLVGRSCALCRERISREPDGRFCPECRCPVHDACVRRAPDALSPGCCRACGAPPAAGRSPGAFSTEAPKQRHGCLAVWLALMLIANGFAAVSTPLLVGAIQRVTPNFPAWVVWPVALLSVLNVVFAIALFNWKKWGFSGFLGTSLVAFGLNLYAGIGIPQAVVGLLGVAILYGVLRIGGEKNGWSQLE